ncbi:MAG: DHH family phosphoesterase, partial [bacterium]
MHKQWIIQDKAPSDWLASIPYNPIIAQLLYNRGLKTEEEINCFLNPSYDNLDDPFKFKDMKKAVELIMSHLNHKIVIHGDYDSDGVCSSVILYNTLKALGGSNIMVYLPHREKEGYGLNSNTIKYLREQDCNLIITADCGSSNVAEIALAKELGM